MEPTLSDYAITAEARCDLAQAEKDLHELEIRQASERLVALSRVRGARAALNSALVITDPSRAVREAA